MKDARSFLGWSGFIFLLRMSGAVTVLVTQVLLARWMGAYELGVYVFAFSWLILLSTAVGLGFPMASMRIVGKALHEGRTGVIRGFVRRGRLISFSVGVLVAALGIALVLWLPTGLDQAQRQVFVLAFAAIPVLGVMRMHERVAQAHDWFVLAMLPNMFLRPLLFLLLVWLAVGYADRLDAPRVMLLHVGLIVVMASLHYVVFGRRLAGTLEGSRPEYRDGEWFPVAMPLLIVTLFSQYFADLDITVVGLVLPPDQLALYNAAYRVALVITFGFLAVNAVLMPRVSKLFAAGDRAGIQKVVRLATLATFAGASLAMLLLVAYGREILALFGDEFVPAYRSMLILAASQVALAAIGPVAILLSVTGHQLHCLRVFSWSLLALVVLSIVLASALGMEGAAWAVFAVTLFWAIWLRRVVRELMGVESSILSLLVRHSTAPA